MTYIMSDIHGRYDLYARMLEQIECSERDELYILGDVIDKGEDGIAVLLDLLKRKNAHLMMGNHEDLALPVLRLVALYQKLEPLTDRFLYKRWMENDGKATAKAFLRQDRQTQQRILSLLQSLPHRASLTVSGQVYHLSHSLPDEPPVKENTPKRDFLWGEPDYRFSYEDHTVFITGHTPTHLIDPACHGRIWRGNGHIAIDCAAAYGGALGCVCLETQEEYYVTQEEKP